LSNAYERGAFSVIPMRWDDHRAELHLGERRGAFAGMPGARTFIVHRAGPGRTPAIDAEGLRLRYSGQPMRLALGRT